MNSWTVAFWWHQLWHTLHPISSALICSQLSANYNSSCSVQVPLWWGHLPQLFFSSRVPALFQFFSPLYLESLPPASLSSPVPFTLYLSLPLPRYLSLSLLSRSLAGFLSDSHQRSSCADSLITGEISERSSTKLQTPMTASGSDHNPMRDSPNTVSAGTRAHMHVRTHAERVFACQNITSICLY